MKWLNLEIATLHSERYIGEDPVGRATWIALLTYCAEQENGGFIDGCGEWKDRKWQQVMGVTLDEVKRGSALWSWERGGLAVWKYPVAKEREVQTKRVAADNTNNHRWGPNGAKVAAPSGNGVIEGFDQFWRAYPNKKARYDAERAFVEVLAVDKLPVILAAIEKQRGWDAWTAEKGRFIPSPANWLRDGRWNDQDTKPRAPMPSKIYNPC